jgi:hypothetical protein
MGYYIRVLALRTAIPTLDELKPCVPAGQELRVESGQESDWSQLVLSHKTGQEIALIERNPVIPGELGEEELNEFMENVKDEKPESSAKWLLQFLPRVKVIYAFQVLNGAEVNDGWDGLHTLQGLIWGKLGGILQADQEGFSNEDGHHILWQFMRDHNGPWKMAVLDANGKWIAFEMNLGNAEHKEAFLAGRVPERVKLL